MEVLGGSRAMSTVGLPSVIGRLSRRNSNSGYLMNSLENVPVEDVEDIITLSDPRMLLGQTKNFRQPS